MTKWLLFLAMAIAMAIASAGCMSDGSTTASSVSAVPIEPALETQPVVVLRAGASRAEVGATRWSGRRFSADGTRPSQPVLVGPSAEIIIEFARPDVSFEASLTPVEGGAVLTRTLSKIDASTFRLDSIGHVGLFDVAFFGRSPTGIVEIWVRWIATA
jgi:hypothetical protein